MLTACASSGNDPRPAAAPDPVIETRTETVTVCPAELRQPLGARPQPATGAVLTGNDSGMGWVKAILARLGLLEDRFLDAAKGCP